MKKHDSSDSYHLEEKEHGKGKGWGYDEASESYGAWKSNGPKDKKGDDKHKGGYRALATYDSEYYGDEKEEKDAYYWAKKDAKVSGGLCVGAA